MGRAASQQAYRREIGSQRSPPLGHSWPFPFQGAAGSEKGLEWEAGAGRRGWGLSVACGQQLVRSAWPERLTPRRGSPLTSWADRLLHR